MTWKRREIERRLLGEVALSRAQLSAKLRQLREQHDPPMTQEDAAHFIGVPARSYVRWENEEVDAFLSSREKIARAYGIDPQELITDPEDATVRLTPEDFARVEAKLDRVLAFIDQLATASDAPARPPVAEFARRAALRLDGTPAAATENAAAPDAADRAS